VLIEGKLLEILKDEEMDLAIVMVEWT